MIIGKFLEVLLKQPLETEDGLAWSEARQMPPDVADYAARWAAVAGRVDEATSALEKAVAEMKAYRATVTEQMTAAFPELKDQCITWNPWDRTYRVAVKQPRPVVEGHPKPPEWVRELSENLHGQGDGTQT